MSTSHGRERGTYLRRLHARILRNRVLRAFAMRPRLVMSGLGGLLIGLCLPTDWRLITRELMAWNGGVIFYIALTASMIIRDDHAKLRQRAQTQDEGRFVILTFAIFAAIASVGAIVAQLAATKDMAGMFKALHIALAASTIVTGWTFIHLTFALHYAHEYAGERRRRESLPEKLRGGLDFPDTTTPSYADFVYFSFIIGVATQTAEVAVCSPLMRRIALLHGVMSFFFNTIIVALTINIAAGLI